MDDGELDFSDQDMFSGGIEAAAAAAAASDANMESFLDEILKGTHTCTHTHTCNPPGPDKAHTHTCFHTHTQLFATPSSPSVQESAPISAPEVNTTGSKKKRPSGNREAVRKYREKKKAHAAYLEEQVGQLKALNQQLVRRLRGQAALEAEVVRLRALLANFRAKIDGELGSYGRNQVQVPQQQQQPRVGTPSSTTTFDGSTATGKLVLDGGFYLNAVTVPCDADVPCFHHEDGNGNQEQVQVHQACDFVSEEGCHGLSAADGGA